MATAKEKQDEGYKKIGFFIAQDFEVPNFTEQECASLMRLAELAKKKKSNKVFLIELAEANIPYEVIKVYRTDRENVKSFTKQLIDEGETGLPDDMLFHHLNLYWKYENVKSFYIQDGGETREGKVFKEDGETVKNGFIRLYFK